MDRLNPDANVGWMKESKNGDYAGLTDKALESGPWDERHTLHARMVVRVIYKSLQEQKFLFRTCSSAAFDFVRGAIWRLKLLKEEVRHFEVVFPEVCDQN